MIDGTLKNATIVNYEGIKVARGAIYNDAKGRFDDGTVVTTSSIISGPNEDGIIHTRNSVYMLELNDRQD